MNPPSESLQSITAPNRCFLILNGCMSWIYCFHSLLFSSRPLCLDTIRSFVGGLIPYVPANSHSLMSKMKKKTIQIGTGQSTLTYSF